MNSRNRVETGPSIPKGVLERVMGIEPTLSAWEAEVLPLNYTRKGGFYPSLSQRLAS